MKWVQSYGTEQGNANYDNICNGYYDNWYYDTFVKNCEGWRS